MRTDKLFRFSIISSDFGHCFAALLGSHKVSHDDYRFRFSQRRRSILCLSTLIADLYARRKGVLYALLRNKSVAVFFQCTWVGCEAVGKHECRSFKLRKVYRLELGDVALLQKAGNHKPAIFVECD